MNELMLRDNGMQPVRLHGGRAERTLFESRPQTGHRDVMQHLSFDLSTRWAFPDSSSLRSHWTRMCQLGGLQWLFTCPDGKPGA